MASIITIILFFAYFWGFGYAATLWVKNVDNAFERNLMRLGIGYAGFTLFGVILNFFHLPIDWKLFVIAAALGPLYGLFRAIKNKSFKLPEIRLTKSNLAIAAVIVIALLTLGMYTQGAFSYPYLEDDDPWGHALGAKYIATEKTLNDPPWLDSNVMGYIDPYPPGYEMLMGVLHQTSPELSWTLKFFNALIISVGIVFFYFFALRFLGNRNKALMATVILALIPSYLSHFIWAHSLIPTIFFVTMYTFLMVETDKRWLGVTTLMTAGILFTHQRQPFNMAIFFIIFVIGVSIAARRIQWRYMAAAAAGLIISFLWWLPNNRWIEQLKDTGVAGRTPVFADTLQGGNPFQIVWGFIELIPKYFRSTGGSGTRTYSFQDFFFAQKQNMINNPIGIGIVIYMLLTIGVAALALKFRKELKDASVTGIKRKLLTTVEYAAGGIATILALRYLTLTVTLFSSDTGLFHFLFSLWFDAVFFMLTLILGLSALAIKKKEPQQLQSNDSTGKNSELLPLVVGSGWLVAFFILVNPSGFHIPFGIEPWRTWMHLATPVALLTAEGVFFLNTKLRKISDLPVLSIVLLSIIVSGMIFTSGIQKYAVNTAPWPQGMAWTSTEELQGYAWLMNLPPNTHVFPYSGRGQNVIGFNAFSCRWCKDELTFREKLLDRTPQELHSWLQVNQYEYLMMDGMAFKYIPKYTNYTDNETQKRLPEILKDIGNSGLFQLIHQTKGAIIFKVA